MDDKGSLSEAHGNSRRFLNALGIVLVVLWVAWWVTSIQRDRLVWGDRTWIGPLAFLAGDFRVHIDHVARIQASGVDAYSIKNDYVCADFPYPPMIPRLFRWVVPLSATLAAALWQATLAAILATSAILAWRTRRTLGLYPVPLSILVAAVLFSTPAIMAMERGQCDPLVIPSLLAVAWLARGRGNGRELATGGLLGVTAWIKYYPGFALFGLIALRRWKAAAAFVFVAAIIGYHDRVEVRKSIENGKRLASVATKQPAIHPMSHSIVSDWKGIPLVRATRALRKVPSPIAAALLLLPLVVYVSRTVGRSPNPGPLIAPYLLWMSAAATFGMPYAVDYNLVSLPIVALCVWDRRDSVLVHMSMAFFMVWWQPIAMRVGGELLLCCKLAALFATGYSLTRRVVELSRSQPADRVSIAYRGPHRAGRQVTSNSAKPSDSERG